MAPIVLRDDGGFFSSVPGHTLTGMHLHHSAPPPHRDDWIAPIQQPEPVEGVTRPPKGVPCWVDLEWDSGRKDSYPAFAQAWTSELVLVQWVEQSEGRRVWVRASQCRRRALKGRA